MAVGELRAWLDHAQPMDFPYDAVLDEYGLVGKQFVSEDVLTALAAARELLGHLSDRDQSAELLSRFLQVALDKYDGQYDYASYTALALLPMPSVDDAWGEPASALQRRDRLLVQLIADTVQFELDAVDGRSRLVRQMEPDARTVNKRIRLATRAAMPSLARLDLASAVFDPDPQRGARQLCAAVNSGLTEGDRLILQLSAMPVYVLHDEHLFIRVLQMFEATFAVLAVHLTDAVQDLTNSNGMAAASHLAVADATLRESAPLFSLIATMQPEAFRSFRAFTEGASAIQSRNYKILESVCRKPDPDRLSSAAYTSTPEIRERILGGNPTLDDAFVSACTTGRLDTARRHQIEHAMRSFSATLQRWRHTHYRLAVHMIGDSPGTGYTVGTAYLASVRSIEVFRSIDRSTGGEQHEAV